MTLQHFDDFLQLLPTRGDSDLSWTINIDERKAEAAQAATPHKAELLQIIETKGQEVIAAPALLRQS